MTLKEAIEALPNLAQGDKQRLLDAFVNLAPEDKQKLSDALAYKLTSEQTRAVNDYVALLAQKWLVPLGKVAGWVGLGSGAALVSFLVVSLVYVFFILPNKAVGEAEAAIERRVDKILSAATAQVQASASQATKDLMAANQDVGRAKELSSRTLGVYDELQKKADNIGPRFDSLSTKIASYEKSDVAKIGEFFELAEKYPQASELASGVLSLEKKVEQVDQSITELTKRFTERDASLEKLYQYGVASFLQAVFCQGGGASGIEATNFPNGKVYYLDAQIPSGAEVVEAWAVPYQQANDVAAFYQYAVERDPNNSRQIVLRVSAAPPQLQRSANLLLRVYVLYRHKVALAN